MQYALKWRTNARFDTHRVTTEVNTLAAIRGKHRTDATIGAQSQPRHPPFSPTFEKCAIYFVAGATTS